MFDFLRPKDKSKDKEKPEPTCYLFIGEQQCIGGFTEIYGAIDAARGSETDESKITADMAGENILYYWEREQEQRLCGCLFERVGWKDVNPDGLAYQHQILIRASPLCSQHHYKALQPGWGSAMGINAVQYITLDWRVSGYLGYSNLSDGDPLS